MRVVQLIGPYAGKVVEMPYHVATNCLASGTACRPGDVHNHRVKGLRLDQFDVEALTGKTEMDLAAEKQATPKPKPKPKPKAKRKRKK